MLLAKRTPGSPLSEAELRQRRNAARARWAAAGVGGAAVGAAVGAAREGVFSAATAERYARSAGLTGLHQLNQITRELIARRVQDRQALDEAYLAQMRARPPTVKRQMFGSPEREARLRIINENKQRRRSGLAVMTRAEEEVRLRDLLREHNMPRPQQPVGPMIGTPKDTHIYDYQIGRAQRRLRVAERWRNRMIEVGRRAAIAAGDDPDFGVDDTREVKAANREIASIKGEIDQLQGFKAHAARTRARRAHQRQLRGKNVPVQAAVGRQHRGGETEVQQAERISEERRRITARRERVLDMHDRRTRRLIDTAHVRTIEQNAEAIRQLYTTGAIRSRILKASGRGALIGAVAGLSATGIAALARHVATAGHRKRQRDIEKQDPFADLAKASPEDETAIRLAQQYRRWIDRLLGRSEDPLNLGDGFVDALGPGITEAFAKGLTNPPIQGPDDPRYRIDVDFDLLNPAQRRHMAQYALDRIVAITDEQRESIRDALQSKAVLQGIGPYDVARTIKEAIGLTPYQRSVVASFRQQLNDLDPRALERELRDKRYDSTVRGAIRDNDPLAAEQIDAMVDAYHRKFVALRAQTIARTEALRATSFGGIARVQDVLDRHPVLDVTKRWLATSDNRTRETHRDLNGKEVEGMDGVFLTSAGNHLRWPLDENSPADEVCNCRCTLQYIFKPKRGQLQAVAA